MRLIVLVAVLAFTVASPAPTVSASAPDLAIEIVVSPSTVYLDSQGTWVTVHADIPYGSVARATVALDGIPVDWTKADSRGDLVAKFALDGVKAILPTGTVTLTLTGETLLGLTFSGSDEIRVIGPR